MYFHLLISIICCYGYFALDIYFKFLVAPYVIYLIFSNNSKYFPALIIHFIPGSIISYFILIAIYINLLFNIKYIKKYGVFVPYLLLFIGSFVYLYQSINRYVFLNMNFIDSIIPIGSYFCMFAFFYGLINIKSFGNKTLNATIIVLFICICLNFILNNITIRVSFLSFPIFTSIFIYFICDFNNNRYINNFIFLLSIISVVILLFNIKILSLINIFTIFFSVSILILIKNKFLFRHAFFRLLSTIPSSRFTYIVPIIFSIFIIINANQYIYFNFNTITSDFDKMDLTSQVFWKIYNDRIPLWAGVIKHISEFGTILPPLFIDNYYMELVGGSDVEITFGSHNLFLELVRVNGYFFGIFLSFIFLYFLFCSSQILLLKNLNTILLIISSSLFSVGIIGSLFGHFILMPNFSFIFLFLAGNCYGVYKDNKQ